MPEPVTISSIGPVVVGDSTTVQLDGWPERGVCSACGERIRWPDGAAHVRSHGVVGDDGRAAHE